MVDEIATDDLLIHHFSLGSRASRTAFALPAPDGARLPQHHAARVLPRRARSARAAVLSRPPRAAAVPIARRSRARRFGVQPAGARGARASRRTAVLPVVPDFIASRRRRRTRACSTRSTTSGRTSCSWGASIPNKRPDNLIRYFHAYKTLYNPRRAADPRGVVRRIRRRTSRSCTRSSRGWACDDVHILGQVTNEELTALYDVADLFLCASEHEGFCVPLDRGVLQARAGARLRGHGRAGDDGRRRRAVRHARSAAGRRADAAVLSDDELEDRDARGAGRRARAAARAGLRRH